MSWFQSVDFFPLTLVCIYLFFLYLIIFAWISDTVNFTLWGAKYFCIHVSIFEICPGSPLNYFETACFFWVLLSGFATLDHNSV